MTAGDLRGRRVLVIGTFDPNTPRSRQWLRLLERLGCEVEVRNTGSWGTDRASRTATSAVQMLRNALPGLLPAIRHLLETGKAHPERLFEAMLSLAGAPPLAGFFGEFAVAAAIAQSGHFELLAVGLVGWVLGLVATVSTLRVLYIQSPLEDSRRGSMVLPVLTALSTAGAVALCGVIVAYGVFAYPIMSLADQGAEALGLR